MLYDIKGNKIDLDISNLKVLGRGAFGEVYRFNKDSCLKLMYSSFVDNPKKLSNLVNGDIDITFINPDVLVELKNINAKGLCLIKDVYYDCNNFLGGYLMEYLRKEDIDLFKVDSKYILDSFNEMIKACIKLSDLNIELGDIGPHNVIKTKDGMKLIDFDLYSKCPYDTKECNYELIFELYRQLFEYNKMFLYPHEYFNRSFDNLFNLNYFEDSYDLIENFRFILTKYKKPIDYLNRR